MKYIMLIMVLMLFMGSLYSQVAVEIVNEAEDSNGNMLVTKFRDLIRSSQAYELSYADDVGHFVVIISTMDKNKGDVSLEGLSTIYDYIILIKTPDAYSIYCYHQLGFVGKSVLDDVAYQIYSDLDEYVEGIKNYIGE